LGLASFAAVGSSICIQLYLLSVAAGYEDWGCSHGVGTVLFKQASVLLCGLGIDWAVAAVLAIACAISVSNCGVSVVTAGGRMLDKASSND